MGCEEEACAVVYGRATYKQDIMKEIKEQFCVECEDQQCARCEVGVILQMINLKG